MKFKTFGLAGIVAFAFGVGVSFGAGAAQSCGAPCQAACTTAYHNCIASGISRDKCLAQAAACIGRCRCPVP